MLVFKFSTFNKIANKHVLKIDEQLISIYNFSNLYYIVLLKSKVIENYKTKILYKIKVNKDNEFADNNISMF